MNNPKSLPHQLGQSLLQVVLLFIMISSVAAAQSATPSGAAAGVAVSGGSVSPSAPSGTTAIKAGSLNLKQLGEGAVTNSSQLLAPSTKSAEGSLNLLPPTPQESAIAATTNNSALSIPSLAVGSKNAQEPSAIESAMMASGKESVVSSPQTFKLQTLQQFGYNFFNSAADKFAAMDDIPVGSDYLLGTGDRINLTVWGGIDASYPLEVNRSGEIIIPKVGPVKVSGVAFGQLPQLLSGQLSRIFRNFQLSVTMGKLRMIKVYVVGDVAAPGDYNISSMSTLLNALSMAGGPTRSGTLRSIAIKRNGKLVDTVDLYDFFLKGDKSRDIRLQHGDTVFVPSIGSVAGIAGNVRRPGIFELKDEKNLKDLLALADGIVPTGYLQRLQISRVDAYEKKSVLDVNLDPKTAGKDLDSLASAIPLKDMDLVKIYPIDSTVRGYVRLSGYVLRPGDYAIKSGMTLRDLLPPDNLLPEYNQTIGTLIRLVAPDFHPEMILINPAKASAGLPGFNPELQEFDTIKIYSRWEMEEMPYVRINGEVQKPGEYRLLQGMTVRDLLYTAGNVKLTAFMGNAEIARMHRSGSAVTLSSLIIDLGKALANDPKHNIQLEPFDVISIRQIPDWSQELERYVTVSGEVKFPGVYPIFKGERISDILRRSGGFTERAYLRGAKFTRVSVRELQQKRMDEILLKTESDIVQKQSALASVALSKEELDATKAALDALQSNARRIALLKPEGRVVIHLDEGKEINDSEYDMLLEGGDVFYIPQRPSVVNVMGYVYNPGSFVYLSDNTASSYLELSGGPVKDAETSEIYLLRADGSVASSQQTSFFSSFLSKNMGPGDTLVVPQKLERVAWLRDIKDWTQILANIALTAGTVMLGLR